MTVALVKGLKIGIRTVLGMDDVEQGVEARRFLRFGEHFVPDVEGRALKVDTCRSNLGVGGDAADAAFLGI